MRSLERQPSEYDQLEIRLFEGRVDKYRVELRMPSDRVAGHLGAPPANLESITSPLEYGEELSAWLFQGEVGAAFRRARWATESYAASAPRITGLRVRLWIEPGCAELTTVMWETLSDPGRREPLALTTAFSRVLKVSARPIHRERPTRMLLITASPHGLSKYDLTKIDVDLERRVVQSAIGLAGHQIQVVRLGPQVTIDDIQQAEKEGVDITHLVAHAISEGEKGYVLLANSGGSVERVGCDQIASALVAPSGPPALAYIATPTEGERESLTRLELGRALLEAGVQAVVVIQAPIQPSTLELFTERFYSVLIQTGSVDQAIADARVAIFAPDSWNWVYPVLMLNAEVNVLWNPEVQAFESIVRGIQLGKA